MKFKFKAKNSRGEIREGKMEATSSESAIKLLQDKELIPISVEQEQEIPDVFKAVQHLWEGVSLRELSVFYRQMATLVEAKVSIVASLKAVGDQTPNAYLKIIISEMIDDVQDGTPLSEAMAKHSDVFENLAVSMVKAGELSGNLQRSIMYLSENTEKNYELNSKIKGALFYPAFVLSASIIVAFVVFTFVLPKLTAIFKDMNVVIPWYTQMLMDIGDFMSRDWWIVLTIIIALLATFTYYFNTDDGKREWDALKIKLPVVGNLFQYVYISRFSENLAVLLDGGIPIVRALTIVSEVVNNSIYEAVILRAADEVKSGGAMSNVFARSSKFPPIVAEMVKIGEEAGKVSDVLKNVAAFYGQETERMTRNLSTMLEPILIVILGAGVALIVFSILVPIYNIAGSMG